MLIKISQLKSGLNEWQEKIPPGSLSLDSQVFQHAVAVRFRVDKQSSRLAIDITAAAEGEFVCDRCSEDFKKSIDGSVQITFIERAEPIPDEMPGDDLRSFRVGQDEIDLSVEIRDALLLAQPIQVVCQDDCKGLCAGCGANLNFEECRCENNTSNTIGDLFEK